MSPDELLGRTLLAAACALVAARVFAALLARARQPPALGEILAGVALGPTLLGALSGSGAAWLFPDPVRGALGAIGSLGLVLFMFLLGVELDVETARTRLRLVVATSVGALVVPFALGLVLATTVLAGHAPASSPGFVVFVATVMAITAFPVLARILQDHGLQRTPIGHLALAAAAVQDAAGWLLVVTALALSHTGSSGSLVRTLIGSAAFAAILLTVVRPVLRRAYARSPPFSAHLVVIPLLLLSAAATQLIGLHAAIGAFALGLCVPRRGTSAIREDLGRDLTPLVFSLLLPIYFISASQNVDLTHIGGAFPRELLLIVVLAVVGKIGGAVAGARLGARASRQDAWTLGVLLNTRGLMELVVLQIGLARGIIDTAVFSMFVVMAIVTTLMTGPLLARIGVPLR